MPTAQDESFAQAVIRLKLADEGDVSECMKTVAEGAAPCLADAMIRRGLMDAGTARRILRETAPPAPAPWPADAYAGPPPAIDGYEILSKLGEGGMGMVWKARQTSLDRLVAIKLLPLVLAQDRNFIARFRREALATAKLNHPNIVSAIDVGIQARPGQPDLHYFVMEYVDGETVEDVIYRSGKIAPRRAAEIAAAVARALDYAWSEARIVHRDIKPANILITRNGTVKLADLGLARSTWEDANLTTAGLAIGTPHYASPEQARGDANIDTRSDIYALGATLFHMLTGRTVFEGESAAAVLARHVNEDPPSCRDVNPQVPPALAAVVSRMMRRNPAQRYQTAGEAVQDIERFLRGDRPLAYTRVLDAAESAPGMPGAKPAEGGAPARSGNPLWRHAPHALATALFLGGVAVALWYAVEHRGVAPHVRVPKENRATQSAPPATSAPAEASTPSTPSALPISSPPPPFRLSLSFHLSKPDGVVGHGTSFPLEFRVESGVRCLVKPERPAYVYVFLVSDNGPSGTPMLRLLEPAAGKTPLRTTGMWTPLPSDAAFYSLPPSARTVAFVVVAVDEVPVQDEVAAGLVRVAENLANGAALEKLPHGLTLWFSGEKKAWTTGSGEIVQDGAATVLGAVCDQVRALFGNHRVGMSGVAASCVGP